MLAIFRGVSKLGAKIYSKLSKLGYSVEIRNQGNDDPVVGGQQQKDHFYHCEIAHFGTSVSDFKLKLPPHCDTAIIVLCYPWFCILYSVQCTYVQVYICTHKATFWYQAYENCTGCNFTSKIAKFRVHNLSTCTYPNIKNHCSITPGEGAILI